MFYLLTLLAYERYCRDISSWKWYSLVILSLALGLMAKPMGVTLPFVLLLLDYWPLRRLSFNDASFRRSLLDLFKEKIPLFLLIAASSLITYFAQQRGGAVFPLGKLALSLRLSNALTSYVRYIGEMLWPHRLAIFYPYDPAISSSRVLLAALLLTGSSVFVIWAAKQRPYLFTGWFWYVGTLVPVIGLVQVGEQAMADRYTYVPFIGLFIIIAWEASELLSDWRYRRVAAFTVSSTLVLTLGALSYVQVGLWRDTFTLFKHTLAVTSDNYIIQNNLGYALLQAGRPAEAIAHFSEALRIAPHDTNALNNLGLALTAEGKVDEAIAVYSQLIRRSPNTANYHFNIGTALAKAGKNESAIAELSEAVRLDPDYADAHHNLGVTLSRQGRLPEAIAHLSEAVRLKPDSADAYNSLGAALFSQGKIQDAIYHYQRALQLNPHLTAAQNNIERALAISGSQQGKSFAPK